MPMKKHTYVREYACQFLVIVYSYPVSLFHLAALAGPVTFPLLSSV